MKTFSVKRVLASAVLATFLGASALSMSSCTFTMNGRPIRQSDLASVSESDSESSHTFKNVFNGSLDPSDADFSYARRVMSADAAGTVAEVTARVAPTVVEIQTETVATNYFGQSYTQAGAGSGVIISKSGCIVTCYHVVEGCTNVYVYTNDGTQYTADVVGYDVWSDIALLKIESDKEFPTATFATYGDNGENYIVLGEQVIAIGNPLGYLGGTVTVGYVSALSREITIEGIPMTLIQTDTAVSPGNSGGALFNLYGELVGIVNAKSAVSGAENIGFAIPSAKALTIVDQLASQGYVSGTPYLGLSFSSTSSYLTIGDYLYPEELAELNPDLDMDFEIKPGDLLMAIDGSAVSSMQSVRTAIARKNIGDTIVVTIYRLTGRNYFGQSTYTPYEVTIRIHEYVPETAPVEPADEEQSERESVSESVSESEEERESESIDA